MFISESSTNSFETLLLDFVTARLSKTESLQYISKSGLLKPLNFSSPKAIQKVSRLENVGNLLIIDTAKKIARLPKSWKGNDAALAGFTREELDEALLLELQELVNAALQKINSSKERRSEHLSAKHLIHEVQKVSGSSRATIEKHLFVGIKRRCLSLPQISNERRQRMQKRLEQQRHDKREAIKTQLRARQHDQALFQMTQAFFRR